MATLDEDDSHQQKGLSLDQVSEYETKKDMYCNTCHVHFSSREEQVEHYRLDWHRYNLKRKLKGLPRVDQEEFEKVAGIGESLWIYKYDRQDVLSMANLSVHFNVLCWTV